MPPRVAHAHHGTEILNELLTGPAANNQAAQAEFLAESTVQVAA